MVTVSKLPQSVSPHPTPSPSIQSYITLNLETKFLLQSYVPELVLTHFSTKLSSPNHLCRSVPKTLLSKLVYNLVFNRELRKWLLTYPENPPRTVLVSLVDRPVLSGSFRFSPITPVLWSFSTLTSTTPHRPKSPGSSHTSKPKNSCYFLFINWLQLITVEGYSRDKFMEPDGKPHFTLNIVWLTMIDSHD